METVKNCNPVYKNNISNFESKVNTLTQNVEALKKTIKNPDDFDTEKCQFTIKELTKKYSTLKEIKKSVSGDRKKCERIDYDQIRKLTNMVTAIKDSDITRLEQDLIKVDKQYEDLEFESSCICCTKNRDLIGSINGRTFISGKLQSLIGVRAENEKIRGKIKVCADSITSSIEHVMADIMDQIKNLENIIEFIEQSKLLNDAIFNLEQLKDDAAKYAVRIECEENIKKHIENEKYHRNKELSKHHQKYDLFREACCISSMIKYNEHMEYVQTTGKSYYKSVNVEIINVTRKISAIETSVLLTEYEKCLQNHDNNDNITIQLNELNVKLIDLNIDNTAKERDILMKDIGQLEGRLIACKERDSRIFDIDEELHKMQLYDDAMSNKKGIIGQIIKQNSEKIVAVWNAKLAKIVEFKVDITFEKDKFNIMLVEDSPISAEAGSGFQKFILDLTFRETMYELAQITMPNFIIIDEGFGTADTYNRNMINKYLKSLTEVYPFIFIISHLDEMQSSADCMLTIDSNGGSHINYGEKTEFAVLAPPSMDKHFIKQKIDKMESRLVAANDFSSIVEFVNLRYRCKICDITIATRPAAIKHCNTKAHLTLLVKKEYAGDF